MVVKWTQGGPSSVVPSAPSRNSPVVPLTNVSICSETLVTVTSSGMWDPRQQSGDLLNSVFPESSTQIIS